MKTASFSPDTRMIRQISRSSFNAKTSFRCPARGLIWAYNQLLTSKVEMACACGKLRGHGVNISPKTGRHLVCMCKDCQAYTRFLGRSDELLNENGGSEIFQITPAQIKLESGLEHLACMRLSPKGTLRWYASCCNTPIANTLPSPALPFAGISCTFIAPQDPHSKETALGPIRQRIFGSEGYGKMPAGTKDKVSVMDIVQTIFWIE